MQRAQLSVILYGLPVVVLCTAGNAGINLAFGVTGVNLDWSDPRHMISGSSGCLGALASIFYLVVSLALFFLPPIAASLLSLPAIIGQLGGLLLGGLTGHALRASRRREGVAWDSWLGSKQLMVDAVAQAVQDEQVDFLDAHGPLVRHADVHVVRAERRTGLAAIAAGAPP